VLNGRKVVTKLVNVKPNTAKNNLLIRNNHHDTSEHSAPQRLLINTFSSSYSAMHDIIKNTSMSALDKQIKIEDNLREY
jgi:hypothetical protein